MFASFWVDVADGIIVLDVIIKPTPRQRQPRRGNRVGAGGCFDFIFTEHTLEGVTDRRYL